MLPIYIYIHVCTINNYLEILDNLIKNIKTSNLYNEVDKIKLFILGNPSELQIIYKDDPKIFVINYSNNYKLYERFTLYQLYEDSKNDDFNVLYLHTKGVTHLNNQYINEWVNYLIYFNIQKYKKCMDLLKNYDVIGVNLSSGSKSENIPIHFSGNFWWSKSIHIRKLSHNIGPNYTDPEFWITSKKNNFKYISIFRSNVNHYHQSYSNSNYINKDFNLYELHD